MGVTTVSGRAGAYVPFRVQYAGPNPARETMTLADDALVTIVYADTGRKSHFGMGDQRIRPYMPSLIEAMDTQNVYWVNWDYPDVLEFPMPMNDTKVDRLLNAIRDRQIVPRSEMVDSDL